MHPMQFKYSREAPAIKYLTLDDQIDILNKLQDGAPVEYLAESYDRSTKTINRIRQLEPVIRNKYLNRNRMAANPSYKPTYIRKPLRKPKTWRRIRGNDITLIKVEQMLNKWIQDNFRQDILMSYVEIKQKALELFAQYKPDPVPGQQAVVFKASKSWLYRFKRRYHLTHLEKTLPRYMEHSNEDDDVIEIDDDDEEEGEEDDFGDGAYEGNFGDGDDGPSTSASSDVHRPPYEPVYITDDEEETFLEGDEVDYENATDAEKSHHETALPEFVNSAPDVDNLPIEQPASFKNETLSPSKPKHYPTVGECDLFGEYVSKHLQQLPLDVALKLQCGIQNLVMKTRLEYARQNPNEVPPIVKKEIRDDPEEEQTNPNENTQEPQTGKRHLDDEPPEAKRRKPEAQTNDKKTHHIPITKTPKNEKQTHRLRCFRRTNRRPTRTTPRRPRPTTTIGYLRNDHASIPGIYKRTRSSRGSED